MKTAIILMFFLLGAGPVFASKSQPECVAPQPLGAANLDHPLKIQGWLRTVGSKVKTVRDFVCCLPKEYRSNYMTGHSSIAGQNGTPDSPRVIMMNGPGAGPKRTPLKLMLSFNGGEHHMAGAKNVEMVFVNPKTKETEFFDLSFEDIQKTTMSGKNPESCMNCHGDNGKAPPGGAKLIFDVFKDWFRFVHGATQCNPEEDKLQALVTEQAVKSVKGNPQYDCLDKSVLDSEGALGDFDNSMGEMVKWQRGRWLKSLPEYDKYKYLLVGGAMCPSKGLTEWMSADLAQRNLSRLEIDDRLKKDGPLSQVFKEALEDEDRKALEIRKGQAKLLTEKDIAHKALIPNTSSRACENPVIKSTANDFVEALKKNDKTTSYKNRDPLTLLWADSLLRKPRFTMTLPGPLGRFFLEGEGHGTYFVQKSLRKGELVHGDVNVPIDLESYESPLRDLYVETKEACAFCQVGLNGKFYKPKRSIEQTCAELKTLSLHELRIGKAPSGPDTPGAPRPGRR